MIFFKRKETDYIHIFNRAISWIEKYSIEEAGIAISSSKAAVAYPEVTGYYIPTLVSWGMQLKAIQFADYLVSIQNKDGSWSDPEGKSPYTFDTGQILKGLLALVDQKPAYKSSILKACDWIVTQQREDGSIATPDYSAWGKQVPEAIHLYALQPLQKAADLWHTAKYDECVQKALAFYLAQPTLTDFTTLSHFHAYIIEGLIDLGQIDRAKKAMVAVAQHQHKNGSLPAYPDSTFVCSTGLLQYALCWYKLGDLEKGNKAFAYACTLQNKTGGWYGSYGKGATYFPREEISWAVKYFLDALFWKTRSEFNASAHIFPTTIDTSDGRYSLIKSEMLTYSHKVILDIGCGKGRFISTLQKQHPGIHAFGVDISEEILKSVPASVATKQGSLLQIPYPDTTFDLSFCVEALEHAIYIEGAIREMARVTKLGGSLVIIDKNIRKMGSLKLSEGEQWFDSQKLADTMTRHGFIVTIHENIPYETKDGSDGLFTGWIGRKQ